jgi:type IV pilus assembly protein PilC
LPTFRYRALDGRRRSQSGRLWAVNSAHAQKLLQGRGLQHIFLKNPFPWEAWLERSKPLSAQEQSLCCRQLAIMLGSGIPVVAALEVLLRQPLHAGLYEAYHKVYEEVQNGGSLSKGLRQSRGYFDDLYVGLVQVGERTGRLVENLHHVAEQLERDIALRAKVKAALTYPLVVTAFSLGLAYFMVQHLLPRFINGLFRDSQVTLPWFTRALVQVTEFFQNGPVVVTLLGCLVFGGWLAWRHVGTRAGELQLYEGLMAWKPTRQFFGSVLAVRTARMLATCVEAGLPMVAALQLTAGACGNAYLRSHLEITVEDLQDGNPLSQCLRAIPFLPPTMAAFVQLGEEASGLPVVLLKAAELIELEVEDTIAGFTQLLEPLLVGALGLFVGFVLIALFIPIYSMLGGS